MYILRRRHLYRNFPSACRALVALLEKDEESDLIYQHILRILAHLFGAAVGCYCSCMENTGHYKKIAFLPESYWKNDIISEKFANVYTFEVLENIFHNRKSIFITRRINKLDYGLKPFDPQFHNELFIPVFSHGKLRALIALCRSQNNKPDQFELDLCDILSSILADYYTRLHVKIDRTREREILEDFMRTASGSLDSFLEPLFNKLMAMANAKFISLWLYNKADDILVLRAPYPNIIGGKKLKFDDFDRKVLDCSGSLIGEVVRTKAIQIFKNANELDKFKNKEFSKKYGLSWLISMPILDNEQELLGVLNIWPNCKQVYYDFETLKYLESYNKLIAAKIVQDKLVDLRSFLNTYDIIFEKMVELKDSRASWNNIAGFISHHMGCEAASIFFLESDGIIHLKGTTGIIGNPKYEDVWYQPGTGLTGTAFLQKEPLIYYNDLPKSHKERHISKYREILKSSSRSKSMMMFPITNKEGKAIGVIRCNNKEEIPSRHSGTFMQEDIIRIKNIAVVISNLYLKMEWLTKEEKIRERNVNSLHHEILSPIEGILSHIEWLEVQLRKEGQLDKERVLLKFGDIKQISKLLEILVTTMGEIDEDQSLNVEPFSCYETLQVCLGFLINEAKRRKVDVSIEYLGIPNLRGDKLQIMRVFYNLLRNAIKYRDNKEVNRYIRVSGGTAESKILLRFEDNGIGIVPGEEEVIFQKFVRGSNASKVFPEGTGLGLAYCRDILGKHDGAIYVDPKHLSKPTVFQIELPHNK